MIFLLGGIAVWLTATMFKTRESMLGFPCGIFWAILGGYCYTLSAAIWDVYYFVFIASALGMTIFSILAAFALREKPDKEAEGTSEDGSYIDEQGKEDDITRHDKGREDIGYEVEPSARVKALRARADKRRTGEARRGKIKWGRGEPLG